MMRPSRVIASAAGLMVAGTFAAGAIGDASAGASGISSSSPSAIAAGCDRIVGQGAAHLSLLSDAVPVDAGSKVCDLLDRLG